MPVRTLVISNGHSRARVKADPKVGLSVRGARLRPVLDLTQRLAGPDSA